ncbi:MAG: glycosyltransferase [Geobacter sp.]|nr:glycosyltransferase [Geobacter sp.]
MQSVSVIIPVLHEQERISGLIEHLKGQGSQGSRGQGSEKHGFEIIVVDGDPQDSTIASITDNEVIGITAIKGRGNQLAAGAEVATGSIILMLHADTLLPDGGLQAVTGAVANGTGWGAFRLGIDSPELAYRMIEWFVDLRCKLFALPYGDQAIFVTRTSLESIGGIPLLPLMEDVELARRLRKAGKCFTLLPQRVQTSPRRWQKDGILRRTLKNWLLLLRYLAGADPDKLSRNY